MATLTLNPSQDSFLFQPNANTNYSERTVLTIQSSASYLTNSVIQFDLSSLPAGAIVSSVTLRLYVAEAQFAAGTVFNAYRLLVDWVNAQVTWNSRKSGTSWTTGGASGSGTDRSATVAGTETVTTSGVWKELSINLTEFESMRSANYGFVLIPISGNNGYKRFSSVDAASNNPELVIEYTLGGVQAVWFD